MMTQTLDKINQKLKQLYGTQRYKKTYILSKLTDFACSLKKLESNKLTNLSFDIMTLRYDIEGVKNIINMCEEHYEWLREEDLKRVNKLYKQYKQYIKDYEQTI